MAKLKTSKGTFHYNRKVLYLGSKRLNKEIALENLFLISLILKENGISLRPVFGTLLGMIRDNDFIEWDEDVDCAILKEDEEKLRDILPTLQEKGFELVRYLRRGLYSFMRNGEYIDFYVLRLVSTDVRHTGGRDFLIEKYVRDTIEWDFKGIKMVIPREYEEYLEFTYGDWKTPKQYLNFDDRGLKFCFHWMKQYIKDYLLPDFLYYPMLVDYHRKHQMIFLQKCRNKGIVVDENINLNY